MGCGLGVIIRDHDGHVERAGVQQTRERWEAEIAEAKAMEFGLQMALQMGIVSIVAESDCKTLVNMLKSGTMPSSYLSNIGRSILNLASQFNVIEFNFVRRDGNRAVHCMAHLLPLLYITRVWVRMVSDSLSDLVATDSNSDINYE
ncbi:uncharacterized protein LOC141612782 [Silene latifolia]|uniref:uncharacterized protein LOC141612782 n=1 Tax=Silene latifolia TaxID=37657 RepID=UPI003D786FD2